MIKPPLCLAAALILAGAGLSACDQGVFVNRSESPTAYSGFYYVQSTAAMGTNQVVVYNSPYPPETTVGGILSAAQARYQSNQYRFFAGPPVADWNGYTVVLAFSDGPLGNQNLCVNRDQPLRPMSAGWTSLFAEYCLGSTLVTEASAYTRVVTGPDDPRFAKLVGGVIAALFEYRPPPGQNGFGRMRIGG
jgi:hypothetical protein